MANNSGIPDELLQTSRDLANKMLSSLSALAQERTRNAHEAAVVVALATVLSAAHTLRALERNFDISVEGSLEAIQCICDQLKDKEEK